MLVREGGLDRPCAALVVASVMFARGEPAVRAQAGANTPLNSCRSPLFLPFPFSLIFRMQNAMRNFIVHVRKRDNQQT